MADDIRIVPDAAAAAPAPPPVGGEPSLGELFKELAQESSVLLKQEMALAKSEMRENLRSAVKDVTMMAAGGAVLLVATLVLTAFLVVLVGDLIGNYWLGALIIGLLYAVVGWILLNRAKSNLSSGDLRPETTIQTLQEDKRWAQNEVRQVKRELT
ncbi:MAG: phage holin family protein [Gemmatimonadota bacterium]|jgi:hypothetical protein|nr:phage holin family protein [Gemmatimonadota bacterium]